MAARFNNSIILQPDTVGLNAAVLSAERTSNTLSADGREQLTMNVNLSTWADATTVSVAVDVSENGTNWFPMQSESTAAGIATLSPLIWRQAVSAAELWSINTPINARLFRIRITSAGGTTDAASVTVRLSNLGNG